MIELTLIPLGTLIATVFSMVGLAGGVLMVPALVLLFGLGTQQAVGVSLFAIMFMTISAAIAYAIRGMIDYRVGLLLDTLDVPGAILGAYITTLIASGWLAGMFGALLLLVAANISLRRDEGSMGHPSQGLPLTRKVLLYCTAGSFLSGVVSAMFGVGGGIIDEAVMILLLGMSIRLSAGTAVFGMAITTFAAVLPHWFLGNILLGYAIPLTVGCVLGGQIGPHLSGRVRAVTLRKVLGVVVILVGLRMLLVPLMAA
jgi:uncharacterized membrane protein YfcA